MEHHNIATIEHRLCKRKPLQLNIIIFQNHIPISVGKTKDLCTEGMGIVNNLNNIKSYSTLEVGLAIPQSAAPQYLRLSGLVVHKSENAFGILFDEMDINTKEILDQLLTNDLL